MRQEVLRKGLNRGRIRFKWHAPELSLLEGIFSRGDRRLSQVIHDAFKMGCRFDGWSESFRWDLWCRAFERNGIDKDFYLRARTFSEILPWNHIRCGVSEEYLKHERVRSQRETGTVPCRVECTACGVCNEQNVGLVSWKAAEAPPASPRPACSTTGQALRLLFEFQKVGPARFLGHLDMAKAFHRAARRARVPLRYSQGFHPMPRISFNGALPLGWESLWEQMEWELEKPVREDRLLEALNEQLPGGLCITRAIRLPGKHRFTDGDQRRDHYLVALGKRPPKGLETQIQEFLSHNAWVVPWDGAKDGRNIRPEIETIAVVQPARIHERARDVWSDLIHERVSLMEIRFLRRDSGRIRIDRALGSILSLSEEEKKQMRILKLGKVGHYG